MSGKLGGGMYAAYQGADPFTGEQTILFLLLPPFPTKENSFRLGSSDDCIWEASPASACVHVHYVDNNTLTNLFDLLEQNILHTDHTHGPSYISAFGVLCSMHSWFIPLFPRFLFLFMGNLCQHVVDSWT
jgi:hypothetical protein